MSALPENLDHRTSRKHQRLRSTARPDPETRARVPRQTARCHALRFAPNVAPDPGQQRDTSRVFLSARWAYPSVSSVPGAARFALALGYLLAAPSALAPGYHLAAPSALAPGYHLAAPSALAVATIWPRLRRSPLAIIWP